MQLAVRRQRASAVGARVAAQIRESSAGFFDDDLNCGHVPPCHSRLGRDLDRAFGNEHVDPEVAEAARAAASALQREEAVAEDTVVKLGEGVVADLRVFESIDRGDVNRLAVAHRALAPRGPPSSMKRGSGDDADFAIERDERGEQRNAANVIFRRVDRIDDPPA